MFQNPDTIWLEILVIVLVILFFASLIGVNIYKKKHHIPTGDCANCSIKARALYKAYQKKYHNK